MINMPLFSEFSRRNLSSCHVDLRDIANAAIKRIDFIVIEGHRGMKKQNQAYVNGFSKVTYPHGEHNTFPSLALDFVPYPFNWSEDWGVKERFKAVWKIFQEEAIKLNIVLRWGGSWGWDSPHIALVSKNGEAYLKTYKTADE